MNVARGVMHNTWKCYAWPLLQSVMFSKVGARNKLQSHVKDYLVQGFTINIKLPFILKINVEPMSPAPISERKPHTHMKPNTRNHTHLPVIFWSLLSYYAPSMPAAVIVVACLISCRTTCCHHAPCLYLGSTILFCTCTVSGQQHHLGQFEHPMQQIFNGYT